jgi:predicted  nucleic acid-binding Zn-ribbon protein
MTDEEFKAAHKRINEITTQVKQIVNSLTADQMKKYEKKAEKKRNKVSVDNRERLQKQLDEITATMPEQQKLGLKQMMERLHPQKQEQLIAELVAQHNRREALSPAEKMKEDQEMMHLQMKFNMLL